ncbi:signal transduction histidine kinase/CheY-like chemotaxis protein/HPt (histidine-containing phosphotransfer) domain-containing protein [Lysobacter niastensis]|uniref:histidine kinase n=1 Tax=Lysobacter niastensis TaxID=380629 RepID=A0ABU1WDT8_9GAMM|nr:ATP-binding protein [Lysobacter niastensis]MDR7135694.1 signal transduction histidine kinase/CheY-like chemotaxis protein/HPt (histidine-containing phosphotransfer) domain-containing protein [Lysobacter niastensis]
MKWRAVGWNIRRQVWAVFVLFLLTALGVVVLDEIGQYRSRQSMQMLKDHSLLGLRRIKTVSDAYGLDLVDTTFRVRNGLMTPERGVAVVDAARERIDSAWSAVASISHEPSEHALFAQAEKARARADAAADELHHILVSGDVDALSHFANHRLYPAIDPVTEALKRLSDQQLVEAEQIVRANLKRQERFSAIRIALSALTLLIVGVIAHRILSNAYRGIESLAALAEGMRRHDFTATPTYRPRGELGEVMDDFVRMRSEVRAFEVELTEQLASNERVRDELQRREHFLSSLLSAAQAAIMAIDEQGRWIVFNPFAERLLGWRAEEVLGRVLRFNDPPRPDDGPLLATAGQIQATVELLESTLGRVVSPDWHAVLELAALQQAPGEWRLHDKKGQAVPVWMALSAFKDERGRRAGVIAVATDLSEIKQLESELRDSELRAREASEAKSSFLATMSHEIRTPMIGINGMVEVLSHTPLDTEQRHALNVIQASAEALLRIIGDILDFSKIEAGRLELAPAAVDLRPLVNGIAAAFAGTASSKGLVLEARIDDRVAPAYRADAMRLRQILGNFVSNAIKFTDKGRVDIVLERVDGPGPGEEADADRLRFSVSDTGIGISEEQRARLFEPFSQAESDTARRYGGTGLGLAISLRLAELMEGEIDMDSEPGHGTTIHLTVRLPRAAAASVPTPTAQTSPAMPFAARRAPSVAEAEAAGTLVLLIDDHPTNRIVISRQLALAGFACEVAEDGREGFERWHGGRFGLVLTDVHMPDVDGYKLARMIREAEARESRSRTPVVALTASALKGEAERCLAAGMDDCLVKPVPVPVLAERLLRWLPHARAAALADEAAPVEVPPLQAHQVLDEGSLDALTGGSASEARVVIDDFLGATAQDLAVLETAVEQGDATAVTRQAHRIKGAARLVGAVELAAAATALESAGRKGAWPAIRPAASDVHTAVARVRRLAAQRYPAA